MSIAIRFAAVSAPMLLAAAALAAPFTAGNLVISRIGDGVATLSGTASAMFLDEFTTAGLNTLNSVALPTVASGANFTITGSGTATSMGFLTRSTDGFYLTIAGFDAPLGTTTPSSNGSFQGRTVAVIDASGAVNSTTRFLAAGSTPRSAASTDGTAIWTASDTGSGTSGGVRAMNIGATSTTLVTDATAATNTRVVNIANNRLYVSANTATGAGGVNSWRGVNVIGAGLPTNTGNAMSVVVGGGGGNLGPLDSAYDFYFADANTLYVADDDNTAPATGGLSKWVFSANVWTKLWSVNPANSTGLRSLTGVVNADGSVQLYGIDSNTSSRLVGLLDTGSTPVSASFSILATSPANQVFRGVDFAPTVIPTPAAVVLLGLGGLAAARRRRA